MLDVRRLRVLREVAALGSFSAAAESLAFTQPAVSRQIATLEAEAGTRLVERSARGRAPHPGGRAAGRPRRRDPRPPDRGPEPARGAQLARGRPPAHRRSRDRQRDADPARHPRFRRGVPRGPPAPRRGGLLRADRRGSPPASSTSRSSPTPTGSPRSPARSCSTHLMDDPLHLALARGPPARRRPRDPHGRPRRRDLDRGPRPRVRRAAAARRPRPPASSRRSASSPPSGWASRAWSPPASGSR